MMADSVQQNNNQQEDIVVRSMEQDLAKLGFGAIKKEGVKPIPPAPKVVPPALPLMGGTIGQLPTPPAPPPMPAPIPAPTPITPPSPQVFKPAPAPQAPPLATPVPEKPVIPPPLPPISGTIGEVKPPAPAPAPLPVIQPIMPPKAIPPVSTGLPTLKIPPRIIPPREFPAAPVGPLPKAAPVWIRLAVIAVAVFLVTFFGLYIYWKIFVQGKAPAAPVAQQATTTAPTLPSTQPATTTPPLKFFNKLPNKAVTIDLPIEDTANLQRALASESAIQEPRESVKQIFLTYQGKAIDLTEFLSLMQIFVPQDFLANFENQYAFFYFSQAEGARAGLILKSKDMTLVQTQMQAWEKSTMPSDILPLFPTTLRNIKTPIAFKSYSLAGQPVRYVNVPVPYASLNYSIYNGFVVITTSSRGMFKVMNDLTGQSVSSTYIDALEASIDNFIK